MRIIPLLLISLGIINTVFAQNRYSSWELFKGSDSGLKQIGWLHTRYSSEIKSSSWSVGCETLDRDYADFSIYKEYVGELGVKHARLQSGWAKCEKEKGIYNFAWLDSCVYGLAEQGVFPWISLSYGNPIYRSEKNLGAGIFTDEETMAAWCRYVEAVVSRYKDIVTDWEIWNEPRHSESTEAYANLLIRTSEVIKKIQPGATLMGFTVHGFSPGHVQKFPQAVLEILRNRNKLNVIDYVTYHPYTQNPDACYSMVEELQKLFYSYNPNFKFYQGESGCPSQLEWGHALSYYPWTEISQAKWLMRRMAGDHVRGIPTSVFTMIDLRYTNMLQSFGLIRSNLLHETIYKRPSYYGVQHMVSFFDDSVEAEGELDYISNAYRKITVACFQKEKKPVVLVWYNDRVPDDEMKWENITLTIKKTNFKDPVYIEMISGKVFEFEKSDWENSDRNVIFKKLPVWDSVIMIVERSQITMNDKNIN
jgi:hypothetical protein